MIKVAGTIFFVIWNMGTMVVIFPWCLVNHHWPNNSFFCRMYMQPRIWRGTIFLRPIYPNAWWVLIWVCLLLRSNLSPLVTVLVTPTVTHWRTHLRTRDQWHNLKTPALRSPKYELQYPWRHLLKINPKKCHFFISAGPQCLTRANGSVPTKRVRP